MTKPPTPNRVVKPTTDRAPVVLALRAADAAVALGISQRLLWTLTNQGLLPHVRLGSKAVVFPVDALRQWLADHATGGTPS